MEEALKRKAPWNSLPAMLSQSHVTSSSLHRDSSCASDDVSDISMATTITTLTNISSTLPELGIPIPLTPKQYLQFQSPIDHEFDGYESGYESDDSELESAQHVEFSDPVRQYLDGQYQDDDDIFGFEIYPNIPMDEEISLYDHCESGFDLDNESEGMGSYVEDLNLDESQVSFETSVHFDTNVSYIETPEIPDDVEDQAEMTMHELMLLARNDRHQTDSDLNDNDDEEDDMDSDTAIANLIIRQVLKDYSRDMIEVDKQIFVAFINGIHGATRQKYQTYLHDRVQGFREGRLQSPFFESDTEPSTGFFLDEALKHVIGMFRNVVLREEFEELARLAGSRKDQESLPISAEQQPADFLKRVEQILSERLLDGNAAVGEDELSFFADGVVYALERPKIYTYEVAATS
ncbi:hypothetical protein BGW36DRAFT_424357 [Talaromyces proteolyticus]|uniref:Uncharacterized protein n=1 Tax=Talaromyces proteolyticus TaxID=1131652 RepID=A0AAD4Q3V8_9EURO|nr:uncharacterized protein BGW36DRAFT_424357 [Talaromyces proteolyticus]KAH8702067.1 hypothetical protein BGW36DRAFT_424357 [Talaromyces proteolyticus]